MCAAEDISDSWPILCRRSESPASLSAVKITPCGNNLAYELLPTGGGNPAYSRWRRRFAARLSCFSQVAKCLCKVARQMQEIIRLVLMVSLHILSLLYFSKQKAVRDALPAWGELPEPGRLPGPKGNCHSRQHP